MSGFGDLEIDITPAEAARRMNEEGMVLIDVREPYEWDAGHVPDSTHIEMERIASRVEEVPADKPVAFLCLAGGRSGMVAGAFKARGFDAYNVDGGFRAWFDAGLPTEPDDAEVAPH